MTSTVATMTSTVAANATPFTLQREISTSFTRQTYYELTRAMKDEITVKDRSYRLTTHKECFLGSDAVGFIQRYLELESREDAVEVGREINDKTHCWEHVSGDHKLKDEKLFFRFTDSSKSQEGCLAELMKSRRAQAKAGTVETKSSLIDDSDADESEDEREGSITDIGRLMKEVEVALKTEQTNGNAREEPLSPVRGRARPRLFPRPGSNSPRRDGDYNSPCKNERKNPTTRKPCSMAVTKSCTALSTRPKAITAASRSKSSNESWARKRALARSMSNDTWTSKRAVPLSMGTPNKASAEPLASKLMLKDPFARVARKKSPIRTHTRKDKNTAKVQTQSNTDPELKRVERQPLAGYETANITWTRNRAVPEQNKYTVPELNPELEVRMVQRRSPRTSQDNDTQATTSPRTHNKTRVPRRERGGSGSRSPRSNKSPRKTGSDRAMPRSNTIDGQRPRSPRTTGSDREMPRSNTIGGRRPRNTGSDREMSRSNTIDGQRRRVMQRSNTFDGQDCGDKALKQLQVARPGRVMQRSKTFDGQDSGDKALKQLQVARPGRVMQRSNTFDGQDSGDKALKQLQVARPGRVIQRSNTFDGQDSGDKALKQLQVARPGTKRMNALKKKQESPELFNLLHCPKEEYAGAAIDAMTAQLAVAQHQRWLQTRNIYRLKSALKREAQQSEQQGQQMEVPVEDKSDTVDKYESEDKEDKPNTGGKSESEDEADGAESEVKDENVVVEEKETKTKEPEDTKKSDVPVPTTLFDEELPTVDEKDALEKEPLPDADKGMCRYKSCSSCYHDLREVVGARFGCRRCLKGFCAICPFPPECEQGKCIEVPSDMSDCIVCGNVTAYYRPCKCIIRYCSQKCMKEDHKLHKQTCMYAKKKAAMKFFMQNNNGCGSGSNSNSD